MNPETMNQKISNPSTHTHVQPDAQNQSHASGDLGLVSLDHILMNEAPLLPTSGFTLSVMDSIRAEATQPMTKFSSAIQFPWKRILPGAILALVPLTWLLWKSSASFLTELNSSSVSFTLPTQIESSPLVHSAPWLLVALAASLLPLFLIRKIMGRSALL
jgi:hypothetical protein